MFSINSRFKRLYSIKQVTIISLLLTISLMFTVAPAFSAGDVTGKAITSNKIASRAAFPNLSFFQSEETGFEISVAENRGIAAIGVRLSEAAQSDVTFTLAYNPITSTAELQSDFSIPDETNSGQRLTSVNVLVPAGSTEASFALIINNNNLDNDDLVIGFVVNSVVGAIALENELKITIVDDENPPIVQLTQSNTTVSEDIFVKQILLTLELIGSKSAKDIVVDYDIEHSPDMYRFVENSDPNYEPDYFYPGQLEGKAFGKLTIPAEQEEHEFYIEIIDNSIPENMEQLTFKITNASNAIVNEDKNQIVITIVDNDSTQNKLTDTGVTNCYSNVATVTVDCQNDTSFPKQDGASFAQRSFVKIDQNGQRVGDGVDWSCVYDVDTGLLWEIKPGRDEFQYTWYNPSESVNGGNEGVEGGQISCGTPPCDISNYVSILNSENVFGRCGVRKWRVPTVTELVSLLNFQSTDNIVNIDVNYFPNTSRLSSTYWTSTPVAVLSDFSWCVDFAKTGNKHIKYCNKTESRFVRLVSTCKLGPSEVEC